MKMYRCLVCGEIFSMDLKECPVCGVGEENFEIIEVPDGEGNDEDVNVLIIGAGIAGLNTASEIRSRNKQAKITIVGKEKHLPYNRTLLTKNFNVDLEHIDVKPQSFYDENNIDLILGVEATKINPEAKEVTLDDGRALTYDYLVLANGSRSIMLNHGDFNSDNVYGIRTKEDVLSLKSKLGNKTVTIVGGGVLGLELASELALENKVNIIEKAPYLMFNNFELKDSKALKAFLNSKGINVYENTSIIKYNYDNVILEDETKLDTDFIIYSIGVASNTQIAKDCGIEVNRGVLVNNRLETNIKDIYACGDIAEFEGRVIALWSNALDMSTAVAKAICHEDVDFKRGTYPLVFKLFENSYYKLGALTDDAVIEAKEDSTIKYYFENEVLVGALAINATAKQGEIYKDVINKTLKVEY